MSDPGGGWQSPSGEPAAPAPRSEYGPGPGTPPTRFASPPGPAPAPSPQATWTPPPKPGLIPLRPLSFGALLTAPFGVLRRSKPLVGLAIGLQFANLVVTYGLFLGVVFGLALRITDITDPDQQPLIAGTVASGIVAALVAVIVGLVVSALLQGFVVVDASRSTLGRSSTIAVLWRRVKPHFGALLGWTAILGAGTFVIFVIVAGLGVSGLAFANGVGLAVSIPIALLVGLAAFVGVVWVSVKLSLLPSALVLERLPLRAAIRRSWTLTADNFWRTLGLQALITVIISAAAQVITLPLSLLPLLGVVIDPNNTGTADVITVISVIVSSVVSILVGAIGSVVVSAAISLIYIDIRMRKEGLDLVLQRWVEQPDDSDPYAPGAV